MLTRLNNALLAILALVILLEEWLWDSLTLAGQQLAHWLRLERFDERLARATPNEALLALSIPLLLVTPLNIAALGLLAHGQWLQGALLELLVKLIGTLLVARVFRLVRTALLTFRSIAWLYTTITRWLHWAHALVQTTAIYRYAQYLKQQAKRVWASWPIRLRSPR